MAKNGRGGGLLEFVMEPGGGGHGLRAGVAHGNAPFTGSNRSVFLFGRLAWRFVKTEVFELAVKRRSPDF